MQLLSLHINIRASRRLIPLGRNDLIVMLSQVQPISRPRAEVVLHVDRASDTLALTNAPVLLKGAGAIDGGLVGTGRDIDVVSRAIGLVGALVLSSLAGVVGAVGFDHVVFDERVAGPAVNGEVAITRGVEGAAVVDGAGGDISTFVQGDG